MAPLSNAERQARHRQRQHFELALIMEQLSELGTWVNELQVHAGLEVRELRLRPTPVLEEATDSIAAPIVSRESAQTIVQLHRDTVAALATLEDGGDREQVATMLRSIIDDFAAFRREALVVSRR